MCLLKGCSVIAGDVIVTFESRLVAFHVWDAIVAMQGEYHV